ncbi:MAG: hypothetical protein GY869_03755, partial [Planctomycetes bacterium]|nr:hypothetical protein [Planctomycetota bacterium]
MTETLTQRVYIIMVLWLWAGLTAGEVLGQEGIGVRDLGGVFDAGYILQDRNDDGVVDFVDVQIVVGENPSRAALVSAANVAARLGYETTGIDLDMVVSRAVLPGYSSGPLIAIGVGANGAEALTPGQGRVRFVEGDDNLRGGVVMVNGADDTG